MMELGALGAVTKGIQAIGEVAFQQKEPAQALKELIMPQSSNAYANAALPLLPSPLKEMLQQTIPKI